ncbi:MAG: helix-turn-helix transcriptional regulator [Spirochaetaceae bacterium]|nr:helix-turn-helix transcriptional regulator [Spirochaetaceae bacterium]
MSSFWMNVKKALVFKELEIKELAYKSNVSYSTIINGMNKNSMPHADIALKISKALNMSLESLLGDVEINALDEACLTQKNLEKIEIALYRKNKRTIDALEELPPQLRGTVEELVVRTLDSIHGSHL